MKLSFVCNRTDNAGKHNDRNFDLSKAEHIRSERSSENKYWTYNNSNEAFRDVELEFYKKNFEPFLRERAERIAKQRNSRRKITPLGYYTNKNTRPEDVIIQVGDYKDHIEPDELWNVVTQYIEEFNEKYGNNCLIIDAALHVDEETEKGTREIIKGTPHVHLRRVWMYEDEFGHKKVGQTKALEEIGYFKVDSDRQNPRQNNNKTLFTQRERTELHKKFAEAGIRLEKSSSGHKREHLTVKEYKAKKNIEMINDKIEHLQERLVGLVKEYGLEEDPEYKKAKASKDPVELITAVCDLFVIRARAIADIDIRSILAEKEAYKDKYEQVIKNLKENEFNEIT